MGLNAVFFLFGDQLVTGDKVDGPKISVLQNLTKFSRNIDMQNVYTVIRFKIVMKRRKDATVN